MVYFSLCDIRTEITALRYFKNVILAGIGDHLFIFDSKSCRYLQKFKIFDGQKIYGIQPHPTSRKCVLFSEEKLAVVEQNDCFSVINCLAYTSFSEWILDARWINSDETIATVSMHNKVQLWDVSLDLKFENKCNNKCVLYSAHIYVEDKKLIIFSGTVFSEVLIWNGNNSIQGEYPVLKRLKGHKGVIFSISYNPSIGQLCSTSDDRSAILWFIDKLTLRSLNETHKIRHIQVYGHTSRVFRCMILQDKFVTAGEDSVLNVWSNQGHLLRKIEAHLGTIWALDYNESDNNLVAGGENSGITVFPLDVDFLEHTLFLPELEHPKLITILASNNIAVVSENGTLYHFIVLKNQWRKISHFEDLKCYVLLQRSHCRRLIALAGFQGQIYIYKEDKDHLHFMTKYQCKVKSRIYSFHWINCNTFSIYQNGFIYLFFCKDNKPIVVSKFILPISKENWTSCAILVNTNFIVGDRKGNLHLFELTNPSVVQTLRKAHNFLGVANLIYERGCIISLGRDSMIKTFKLKNNSLCALTSDKVPFTWLLSILENFLLAFSSNNFIVWDRVTKRILIEISCGGGHRSWDFYKNCKDVMFCYIKDKVLNIKRFDFHELVPKDAIACFHDNEINGMEIFNFEGGYVSVSGGEDTTIRINSIKSEIIENVLILKSHLSSIRAITSINIHEDCEKNEHVNLVFSAGGRAQIICWKLRIYKRAFFNIECEEESSYYEPVNNDESEVRIMDLHSIKMGNVLTLFSACSNGYIEIFALRNDNDKHQLVLIKKIFYKLKCIMKLTTLSVNGKYILLSMATDGCITFWDISDLFNVQKFGNIKVHQSGINSFALKLLHTNVYLFLTGGDDNAITLSLVEFQVNKCGNLSLKLISSATDVGTHCAQVTGLHLGSEYFLSCSIDQRLAVFSWKYIMQSVTFQFVTKYNTTISDIKGIKCFEKINEWDIFIYGNGIEYLKMKM